MKQQKIPKNQLLSWAADVGGDQVAVYDSIPYRVRKHGAGYSLSVNGEPVFTNKDIQAAKAFAEALAVKATWPADARRKKSKTPQRDPLTFDLEEELPNSPGEIPTPEDVQKQKILAALSSTPRTMRQVMRDAGLANPCYLLLLSLVREGKATREGNGFCLRQAGAPDGGSG